MIPDPKWLDALKLPLKASLTVALAFSLLWLLQLHGYLDLGSFGSLVSGVLAVIAIVAWVQTIVAILDYLTMPLREKRKLTLLSARRAQRKLEQEIEEKAEKRARLAHLDSLSAYEVRVVADALQEGSPTFYTYAHSPPVTMLQGKGLVWTPGAPGSIDYYPFSFHDFVWEALLVRKSEFIEKHAENEKIQNAKKAAGRRRI